MKAEQLKVVLHKIQSNLPRDIDDPNFSFETSNGEIHRIRYVTNNTCGSVIEIDLWYDSLRLIITKSFGNSVEGSIKIGNSITRLFSVSWWRWRSICNLIEIRIRNRNKEIIRIDMNIESKLIDEALVEVFPEILEDALFGED